MTSLVFVERGAAGVTAGSLECIGAARSFGEPVVALAIGELHEADSAELARFGIAEIHVARHELLAGFNPEAWGDVLAGAIRHVQPGQVVTFGSDVGNEVMAHAAAVLDLPLVTNVVTIDGHAPLTVRRLRWGGSLIEQASLESPGPLLLTVAPHGDPQPADSHGAAEVHEFTPDLDPGVARSASIERVQRAAGLTLATAPVVVSGGRGVGSADGFAPLEELAALLGGVVGCSRAVTNNGWRNHTDQVGQTGTRIQPEIYIACGISGAIQHWVGAMGSKRILAINTDPQANMVTKADEAVIGDLHKVVPAIIAEIHRRRANP